MTSEPYAATDDALEAVIDHAPNRESTNLSGLVAAASYSLSPDIDTRKPMVVERIQDGETARSGRTARRMRSTQNPAPACTPR